MPYKIDFKELAEQVDIYAVAKLLQLAIVKDRATCPVCDSERALQFFAETNSFRCHSAEQSGDCIALYAHIHGVGMYPAAKALKEQFGTATAAPTAPSTAPQKPEVRTARAAQPTPIFDPAAFASKLNYTDEVIALGVSEEDAERLGIGFYRGRVYFPMKDASGAVLGFIGWDGKELKLPPKWLPSKIVPFKQRA